MKSLAWMLPRLLSLLGEVKEEGQVELGWRAKVSR